MSFDLQYSNSPESSKTFSSRKSWYYYPRQTHTNTSSPIYDYFNSSHIYLKRKYSDYSTTHFTKSKIFLRKDTTTDVSSNSQSDSYEDQQHSQSNITIPETQTFLQFTSPIPQYQTPSTMNIINKHPTSNSNLKLNEQYVTEMYGRKGWICILCDNFNYITRKKCNKCGVQKTPKKIITTTTHDHNNNTINNSNTTNSSINNTNINQNNNYIETPPQPAYTLLSPNHHVESHLYCSNNNNDPTPNSIQSNNKPNQQHHQKDWVCFQCKNVNFSFRVICNRCELPKVQSETLMVNSYQHVLLNNILLNNQQQNFF